MAGPLVCAALAIGRRRRRGMRSALGAKPRTLCAGWTSEPVGVVAGIAAGLQELHLFVLKTGAMG